MSLRSQILKERRAQTAAEIESKSLSIVAHLRRLLEESALSGRIIASFRPMADEPQIDVLSRELILAKTRVVFPRMISETEIEMREIIDFDSHEWSIARGFRQPAEATLRIDPDEIAAFLVPGVVFGRNGERIGFGAGYYDRYLSRAKPNAIKVGIAFDFQLADRLDQNEWDVQMNRIVTESGALSFR